LACRPREQIDTQHLLVGLMAEGVAAAILENLDVSAEADRGSSQRLFGPSPAPAADEISPMSTEAKCAVDAAALKAATGDSSSSAPEVCTEHLLAVLALDPGSRARRVLTTSMSISLLSNANCSATSRSVRAAPRDGGNASHLPNMAAHSAAAPSQPINWCTVPASPFAVPALRWLATSSTTASHPVTPSAASTALGDAKSGPGARHCRS
jgi:hypothetical protein